MIHFGAFVFPLTTGGILNMITVVPHYSKDAHYFI